MKQVADGIYEVPSDSSYGKHYVVNLTHAGRPECTCTDWAMKRNKRKSQGLAPDPYECKHIRQALRADPNLLKKQRDAEAEAYRQRDAAAKAEKQAKADEMKAELLKMRAELHGTPTETTVPATPPPVEQQVSMDKVAEFAKAVGAVVVPMNLATPDEEKTDLMSQLEAAIQAQKGQ